MNKIELFKKIEKHLLEDEKPSIYLNKIKEDGDMELAPFSILKKLEEAQQSEKHHPEGNVWIHTMMVVDEGVKYRDKVSDKKAFMWGLLLHDIGKIKTTRLRKGRWTSYDHDKVGEEEGRKFLKEIINDNKFIEKVCVVIRYHMHLLYIMNKLPFADIRGMRERSNLEDLGYVFLSDRLGRGGLTESDIREIKNEVEKFRIKYID